METRVVEHTMEMLMSNIGTVFTSAMDWASFVGTTVMSNPLLLMGAVVCFVGLGVGLFKRLLHI